MSHQEHFFLEHMPAVFTSLQSTVMAHKAPIMLLKRPAFFFKTLYFEHSSASVKEQFQPSNQTTNQLSFFKYPYLLGLLFPNQNQQSVSCLISAFICFIILTDIENET